MKGKVKVKKIGCLFLLLSGMPLSVYGQTLASTTLDGNTHISLKSGLFNGKSGEYVYDADGSASGINGYKISELQWDMSDVLMAGIELHHRLNDRFALGLNYWGNAAKGDGYMVDYDWLYVGLDWSHRSQHPNTTVHKVSRFDLNSDFVFTRFAESPTDLYGLLGYRQDHVDMQAKGGTAIYSGISFRDTYLVFANVPAISYEQTYKTPYLGLGIRSSGPISNKMVSVDLSARYSQWVKGEAIDIHHMRDLRFVDKGDKGKWLDLALSVKVELRKRFDLLFGIAYSDYSEIKGSTVITDLTDGSKTTYSGDAAGLDHSATLWSLGLNYRF